MRKLLIIASIAIFIAFTLYVAINPGDFGKPISKHLVFGYPRFTDMDDYFITHGQILSAANNIVTSIVFDFRGFDTLGEATVLFAAVMGIASVLRKLRRDEE